MSLFVAYLQGRYSVGVLFYLLAREVLRLRGVVRRDVAWDVPVDLFFYREPEELKALEDKEKAEAAAGAEAPAAEFAEPAFGGAGAAEGEFPAAEGGVVEGFAAPAAGWEGAAGDAAAGTWAPEAGAAEWGAAGTL